VVRQDIIDSIDDIIDLYINNNISIKNIAKQYQCDSRLISRLLSENNVTIRVGGFYNKKYCLEETVFDVINTAEKAYVLGFLYADGYNNPEIGKISISLSIYDRDILEKIRRVFKSTAPIQIREAQLIKDTSYIGAPIVNLTLHSKYLSNQLNLLGVKRNKTTILEFPNFMPPKFLKDFVRGYFDGDGSITIGRHGEPKISLISTKQFLAGIVQNCSYNQWNSKIYCKKGLDENIGLLELNSKEDVQKFCEWIYKDATIKSDRKYNRYYSYYILHQPLQKYPKLSIEELMNKYGYEDIIPQYDE